MTMSSHQYNHVSPGKATSSNELRLAKMRPIATAAKKVISKIKSIRVFRSFRTRTSTNIPFTEREARYVAKHHHETDTGKTGSAANRMHVERQRENRIISNVVQAVPCEPWKLSSEEMSMKEVQRISVSDCDHIDEEFSVTAGNEAGVSCTEPPTDVTNIKVLRRVSQEHQSRTQCDSPSDETTSADCALNINIDTSCETFYTAISEANHVTKSVAHEAENAHYEIDLNHPETQILTPESEQMQQQSSDLSTSDTSARPSLSDLGAHNDTSSALDSTTTRNVADISCVTTESIDNVEPIQNLKRNETLAPGKPEYISITDLDNADKEKARRIERRRILLAKKKEARLKKAMEYDVQETAKVENTYSMGSEVKSSTESPVADDGVHSGAACSEESKTEEESADGPDGISDRAEWSKKEAREAKERRKRSQKERLLNLLSGCIILHQGSAFEGDEMSN